MIDRRKEIGLANEKGGHHRTVAVNLCSQWNGRAASVENKGALPRWAVRVFYNGSFHLSALTCDHTVGIALCRQMPIGLKIRNNRLVKKKIHHVNFAETKFVI